MERKKETNKIIALLLVFAMLATLFTGFMTVNGDSLVSQTGTDGWVYFKAHDNPTEITFSEGANQAESGTGAFQKEAEDNGVEWPATTRQYGMAGAGKWGAMPFEVPADGEYVIEAWHAHAPSSSNTGLYIDDVLQTSFDGTKTAARSWVTVTTKLYLTAGRHTFKMMNNASDSSYIRLDTVKVKKWDGIEPSITPSVLPSPSIAPSPSPGDEVIWTVYQHEDRSEFSTEVAPEWSAEASSKQIFKSASGKPYIEGESYYGFSISNVWIKTRPILPEAGAYRMYLYVPHSSGTEQGRVIISEDGKETRTISRINTIQPEGSWVDIGAHLFEVTEPELTFDYPVVLPQQTMRVDTIKFVPCDESEVTDPGKDDTYMFLYDDADEYIYKHEYGIFNDFGTDYGISLTGGSSHHYCNIDGTNDLFTLKYTPAGTYRVKIKVPLVHARNTSSMFVEVTDSNGQKYEEILDIQEGDTTGQNADGTIRTGSWVDIGDVFTFDPSKPGEVRIGKHLNTDEFNYRSDQVQLIPVEITGEPPVIPPSPEPTYFIEVNTSSANYTQYPEAVSMQKTDVDKTWVTSGIRLDASPTHLTTLAGAWAQFAPYFNLSLTGRYKVLYYNVYKADTVPMEVEIKANGQIHEPQYPIQTGLSEPVWQELGTYEFCGDGDEYVKFTSTGGEYARATAVRFELVEISPKLPSADNISLNGSFAQGESIELNYNYSDYDGDIESGSTYQLYYADSANSTHWSKSVSGSCNGDSAASIQLPAEVVGKYIKVGVVPRNDAGEQGTGEESFSNIIGPVLAAAIAPVAGNVAISGDPVAHSALQGRYEYSDGNFDVENGTVYQWYFADSKDSANWQTIPNASGTVSADSTIEYIIPGEMTGKFLRLGITPKNNASSENTGQEVFSEAIGPVSYSDSKGTVVSLNYGGQIVLAEDNQGFAIGGTIEADSYVYTHPAGIMEEKESTQFQWYSSSSKSGKFTPISGAVQPTYTPTEADGNRYIRVGIKPAAANGTIGDEFFGEAMLVRWNLKFADEFDYVAANGYDPQMLEKWHSDSVEYRSLGSPEIINMMRIPENVETKNGKLYIHNRHETLDQYSQPHTWTTGNIKTKEQFTYGYYESSYKFAPSRGLNQSFWMMSTNGINGKHVELDFAEGHWPRQIATNVMRYDGGISVISHSIKHNEVLPAPQTLADDFNKVGGIFRPNDPKYAWDAKENQDTFQVYFNDKLLRSSSSLPYVPDPGSIWLTCAVMPAPFAGGALTLNPDGSYVADGSALEYEYVRFFELLDGSTRAELAAYIEDAEYELSRLVIGDKFGQHPANVSENLKTAIDTAKQTLNDPASDERALRKQVNEMTSEISNIDSSINHSGEAESNVTYDMSKFRKNVNVQIPADCTNVRFKFSGEVQNNEMTFSFVLPGSSMSSTVNIPRGTKVIGELTQPEAISLSSDTEEILSAFRFSKLTFEGNLVKLYISATRGGEPGIIKNGTIEPIVKITEDDFSTAAANIGNNKHVAFVQTQTISIYSKEWEDFAISKTKMASPSPAPTQENDNSGGTGGGIGGVILPPQPNQSDTGNNVRFTDIHEHWAEQNIIRLAKLGIIKGKSETIFAPEDTMTRAEFAALIRRALNLNPVLYREEFGDIDANDWFANEVQAVIDGGIMSGDTDSNFRPNDVISRQEMAKVIANAYLLKTGTANVEAAKIDFADSDDIAGWAKEYVEKAVALELIHGMDDGTFRPDSHMTRAQGAAVISRLIPQT